MGILAYAIQMCLMALEKRLLGEGERRDGERAGVLACLLRRRKNVGVTAVVANVATAHYTVAGAAAVSLLTNPMFFHWDRGRFVHDMNNPSITVSRMWPARDTEQACYDWERGESAKLPHRKHHLEDLAIMLQATLLRQEVLRVIDAYKAELQPEENQDEEDKLWRLLLHRIDTRNFVVSDTTEDGRPIFQASEPEADIRAVIERHRPRSEAHLKRMDLLSWGAAVFRSDVNSSADPSLWSEKLGQAQAETAAATESEDPIEIIIENSGPDYVEAICGRDHSDELSEEHRTSCANRICAALLADAEP